MKLDYFKISRFFLYLIPFAVVIVTNNTLFPFIVGKYALFRGVVDLALIAFLLGLLLSPDAAEYEKRLKKVFFSPIGIAVGLFALAFFLACVFGVNFSWSFWSNFERGEGGLQILNLYVFFLLLGSLFRNEDDWAKFLTFMVSGAVLMVAYGYAASLAWPGFAGSKFTDSGYRFEGSVGNAAYAAAYIIFALGYLFYLFMTRYRKTFKVGGFIFLGAVTAFLLSAFFLAGTRGAFIGLVGGLVAMLAYVGFKRPAWRKWLFGAIALVLILVGIIVAFHNSPVIQKIPGSRVFDITFLAQTFDTRLVMWQIAWHGFLQRPLFGWGPENFGVVFAKDFNINYFIPSQGFGAWFDRAHSIVFDALSETGAVGTLAYLGMFAAFFWVFGKAQKRDYEAPHLKEQSLFTRAVLPALIVAYLIQGIVLFDVLPIYINYFAIFAMGAFLYQKPVKEISN
ncbi:O-antigen ligase family protein [Patescibacteria group bacterium]|nr:O-antigen ligase family protein [Patescibacteria group bacterium]